MSEAPDPQAISFEDALAKTSKNVRHLLLGNGFSIAARSSFQYEALARSARLSDPVRALFADTNDFELILQRLSERISDSSASPSEVDVWEALKAEVREAFIDVLQRVHPEHAMMMGTVECDRCTSFLEHFVGRNRTLKFAGRVYTTNYDLLLYWAVTRFGKRLWCYDAHFNPTPAMRKPYGIWDPGTPPDPPKVPTLLYLHGALHTYDMADGGQGMIRYDGRWNLVDQSRRRLAQGKFPVIVSEGTTEAKAARIARSRYLTWATGWFRRGVKNRQAVLFTYGHSLDERDSHLIREIGHGRIRAVFIGSWGGLEGGQGETIRTWNHRWQEARRESGLPLSVYVYDTSMVSPWKYPLKGERQPV